MTLREKHIWENGIKDIGIKKDSIFNPTMDYILEMVIRVAIIPGRCQ